MPFGSSDTSLVSSGPDITSFVLVILFFFLIELPGPFDYEDFTGWAYPASPRVSLLIGHKTAEAGKLIR
jgi:hypothetical protein